MIAPSRVSCEVPAPYRLAPITVAVGRRGVCSILGDGVEVVRQLEPGDVGAVGLIGDTNTRVDEMGAIADLGLRSAAPARPTWNSRKNRFHEGAPEFTSYFTRWLATEGVVVDDLDVWDRPIIDQGHRFHVSDHYALTGRITV